MGCGGSKLADVHEKLDAVDKVVKENPTGEADQGLDVMETAAKDLVSCFDKLVKAGVKEQTDFNRIQTLSGGVISNLESRINLELFKKKEGDSIADEVLRIAQLLDAVRATKASDRIAEAVTDLKERMATGMVNRVGTLLEEFEKPETFKEKTKQILDLMEGIHKKLPTSKKITEMLMEKVVKLSELILRHTPAAIAGDLALVTVAEEAGQRLDKVARQLVAVLSAAWDPPCAPKVDEAVTAQASHTVFENLDRITAELRKSSDLKPEAVKAALASARPWWKYAKRAEGSSDRAASILKEQEELVCSSFKQSVESGASTHSEALLQAARDMDKELSAFEGLPSTKESAGDEGGLEGKLLKVKSYYEARRYLSLIEKEMAALALNLDNLLAPLHALVRVWAAVSDKEDVSSQFTSTVAALIIRIKEEGEKAETGTDIPRLQKLQEFGTTFDELRPKLSPPAPEKTGGKLSPAIARNFSGVYLCIAEAEVKKTEGSSPQKMLQALKDFHERYKNSENDDGFERRAAEIVVAIEVRVLDAYRSAKVLADTDKLDQLKAFATKMDEAIGSMASSKPDADGAVKAPLIEQLKAYDEAFKQLNVADSELSKESGLNPGVLLKALQEVAAIWSSVPKSRMLQERVLAISRTIDSRMLESVEKASAAGELQKLTNLNKFVQDLEEARQQLGVPADQTSALRAKLRESLPCAHLGMADAELGKEANMNPQVLLKHIQDVEPLWTDLPSNSAAHTLLAEVCGKVRKRVSTSFTEAVEAKNEAKRDALLKFAQEFDLACSKLSGVRPAGVVEELNARVGTNMPTNDNSV
mmetsp:Transcript_11530/g.26761  ORF Transcript_11530/g.26761 Transcript_11530/m.26761 type:complete len:818 (+) Transcript_11530:88-2541(+)